MRLVAHGGLRIGRVALGTSMLEVQLRGPHLPRLMKHFLQQISLVAPNLAESVVVGDLQGARALGRRRKIELHRVSLSRTGLPHASGIGAELFQYLL